MNGALFMRDTITRFRGDLRGYMNYLQRLKDARDAESTFKFNRALNMTAFELVKPLEEKKH